MMMVEILPGNTRRNSLANTMGNSETNEVSTSGYKQVIPETGKKIFKALISAAKADGNVKRIRLIWNSIKS